MITFLWIVGIIILAVLLFFLLAPQLGQKPAREDLERMRKSPHYKEEKFRNNPEKEIKMGFVDSMTLLWDAIRGGENRRPKSKLPSQKLETEDSKEDPYLTWFGHSTFLYEVNGKKILFDPMLSNQASPLPFGVSRYDYDLPASVDELPYLDFVIISHDHYDHLDYKTVKELIPKVGKFLAPLGVGSHLKRWGVPENKISELDWGDTLANDGITFHAVQSQHFSGRTVDDRQKTLWAAWIINAADTKVFFGGDSGYFEGFKDLGKKYGPFDLTLLDAGQYHDLWSAAHMTPEESVQAHKDLRGKVYMPIHWSAFTLSVHNWTDPVERALKEGELNDIDLITPMIGQRFHVKNERPVKMWWRAEGL